MILTEYDEKIHEKSLLEEGRIQGIQEGEQRKAVEIAMEMLRDGVSPEKVRKYAKLTEDQWNLLLKDSLPHS